MAGLKFKTTVSTYQGHKYKTRKIACPFCSEYLRMEKNEYRDDNYQACCYSCGLCLPSFPKKSEAEKISIKLIRKLNSPGNSDSREVKK